jgi:DNA-binding response OmpR family regulator
MRQRSKKPAWPVDTLRNNITLGVHSLLPSLDQHYYSDSHLLVHPRHQVVMLDDQTIALTRMEYLLLALLVEHAGEVVPRPALLMQIWGCTPEIGGQRADQHIHRLRKKLGVYAEHYIETVPGVGYRFRPAPGP